jgi:hypothetical protein
MAVAPKPEWVRETSKGINPTALAEEVRRARSDGKWIEENMERLRADHSGEFVAVHGRRLVATAGSVTELHGAIRKAGLDPGKCVIEFVLSEDFIWIV